VSVALTLVEVRQSFVEKTGRYDLVVDTTDWADAGADFYIQQGSRFLDRLVTTPFSKAKHYEDGSTGDWYKVFQECRAILDVWVANDEYRKKLEYRDVDTFREYYNEPPSSIDNGTPTYYTPALLRTHPQSGTMYIEKFVDTSFTESSKYDYEYNGIMWMPPTDESIIVEVQGLWYSKCMTADAHKNYWSVNHPELLIMAACYILEGMYRNTEGQKDWLGMITTITSGIEKDVIEQEISAATQMEG
jgi:hypothetical protein